MEHFYGFDLGDAESAVAYLRQDSAAPPEILAVDGDRSFITAYALSADGGLLLGEKACYAAGAVKRRLRFKRRFLTTYSEAAGDVRRFAAGVLEDLRSSGSLREGEESCFYVGCPAGWDRNTREEYRELFERAGYPPVRIVSESRAAMVSACQSKHLQVGQDILSRPVLVVDIGSSTTDFAYIVAGREVEMHTAGEVALGGGVMDELLLERCLRQSELEPELRAVFQESEPWKNYCEFQARRLKERYFAQAEQGAEEPLQETVQVAYRGRQLLRLRMDAAAAEGLLETPAPALDGKSFHETFAASLSELRTQLPGPMPELLFLTGGVSRLPAVRDWCRTVFPEAVVVTGGEPEFSVARGLAWCGRIDERLRRFRQEIDRLKASDTVETIVGEHIDALYRAAVDALVEPILTEVAEPIFLRWRSGELRRLSDADRVLQEEIAAWLRSDAAREKLARPIAAWLKPVSDALEAHTVPICVAYHVPYHALSLRGGLSASEIDIRLEARNMFAVEELTWLIDSIISILVGLLCGGSGIALISSGPAGFAAGIAASFLVLVLGKEKMEEALLKADLPGPMRRLTPRGAFRSRLRSISREVKRSFYENLEREQDAALREKLVGDISAQIEECLSKMAEVVEIPLG